VGNGSGLLGLRDRVEALGARMRIDSQSEAGHRCTSRFHSAARERGTASGAAQGGGGASLRVAGICGRAAIIQSA
jgi:hypothetical protein